MAKEMQRVARFERSLLRTMHEITGSRLRRSAVRGTGWRHCCHDVRAESCGKHFGGKIEFVQPLPILARPARPPPLMAVPGTAFAAPKLKPSDIQACLNDIGIKVTIDDLNKPTPEKTREIYQRLVSLIFYYEREDATAPKFAAMQHIEHHDLHDEVCPEMLFIYNLCAPAFHKCTPPLTSLKSAAL